MSKKLKENQIIAAKLISFGFSSRSVSKWINVREETISRWKAQKIFLEEINCLLNLMVIICVVRTSIAV